ncbi:Ribonuclease H [Porphyridium purpureum]|uniref:ribonuclease H n=1 Tax=Porphyridium purpureum TaxID=35688 RepID=A0A5J4Z5L6_PORPP|nr:Ribonuclease H [Porphyridium purpureum]|eukprot:POR2796..scf295_1
MGAGSDTFYGIRHGADGFCGVVGTLAEVDRYTKAVRGVSWKKFSTYQEARAFVFGENPGQHAPRSVYTDGACANNGKRAAYGGYGVYFGKDDPRNLTEPLDPDCKQTNNRAELQALVAALQILLREAEQAPEAVLFRPAALKTDSKYCMRGINEWIAGWKQNGWKTKHAGDVKNRDLWEQFDTLLAQVRLFHPIHVEWVKAHRKNSEHGNVEADRLASNGKERSLRKQITKGGHRKGSRTLKRQVSRRR